MDDAEQLMPTYLRFVRGVIDSNDLPLNVSREILQESKDIEAIRAGATRRVLSMIEDLAENQKEKFATFWKEFGTVFKEGIGEDSANRERMAKLLRFASTHGDTEMQEVALADYVSRMKAEQEKIYYITADSFAAAKSSPHIEVLRRKGVEVLLLYERIDEWLVGYLREFDGKPLQSAAKGELDLGKLEDANEKDEQKKEADEYKDVLERIKQSLGDRVKDVRVTLRLTDSPACLVADEHDLGGNLQRLLKAAGQKIPLAKPILELNPHHPLVERLQQERDPMLFDDWSSVLFDQALLSEGGQLEDPAAFVKRLNKLLQQSAARESRIILPS
jgi:molecular chaperone HtpG